MEEPAVTEGSYFLGDSDDVYSFDEEKLHRMAMRYRKISSQMIQIYLDSCHFGEQHIIQSMIQENALTDHVVNYRDSNGRTGLSYACEYGYDDIVKTLARCGDHMIDPNIADKDGNTPLMYASQAGHELVVSILLNYFPSLDVDHINDFGLNSLMKAAIQGNSECARLLILSGASPFITDGQKQLTADAWATYCGRTGTADLIKRLKITLGPKLCSLCGYTKPMDNCPGHSAGLCKTHTPNASRLDIAAQCNASQSMVKLAQSGVQSSQCKVYVQCPSGSIIDIHSPEPPEPALTTMDPGSSLNETYEAKLEAQIQLLKTEEPQIAASCPSIPNQHASVKSLTATSKEVLPEQQNLLLNNKSQIKRKPRKRKGLRGRLLNLFTCFVSQEIGSKELSPKFGSNKRGSVSSHKKQHSGSSIKRSGSYSRQAQVSRRISFSA
ncbi:uncharacterized protein LOC142342643 [Convolutriloba macropyga]|uniref:uncharacterized protein LOC142342643 n=1 Tax=Convolutriloba macropyga TaxID=536237 RepID=UPI003F5285CD